MSIFNHYQKRYESTQEEELSIQEFLELCRSDPKTYATASERMLHAIGEPEFIDTSREPRMSRIFQIKSSNAIQPLMSFMGWKSASKILLPTSSTPLKV